MCIQSQRKESRNDTWTCKALTSVNTYIIIYTKGYKIKPLCVVHKIKCRQTKELKVNAKIC